MNNTLRKHIYWASSFEPFCKFCLCYSNKVQIYLPNYHLGREKRKRGSIRGTHSRFYFFSPLAVGRGESRAFFVGCWEEHTRTQTHTKKRELEIYFVTNKMNKPRQLNTGYETMFTLLSFSKSVWYHGTASKIMNKIR